MNAYGYARVSTARQADEGLSLAVQQERIELFCRAKGWNLVQSFEERGASATTLERRPALERAIKAVCKDKGVLVFFDLSRLARNTRDAQEIFRRIADAGANLASVTEPFDSTAAGRLMFDIMTAFAAFDSRQKGEKIAASNRRTVREKGYRTNGVCPAGFRLEDGVRVPCEREREVIAIVRELPSSLSYAEMAGKLNAEGTPTIAALRSWKINTAWTAQRVRAILNRDKKPLPRLSHRGQTAGV